MSNVYTSAEELNLPAKAERARDRVRAEILSQLLLNYATGKADEDGKVVELDPGRVQACKILIDKGKPSLSSVDTTVFDGDAEVDPAQVEAKLRMLIAKAEPALLSRILGERARQAQGMPAEAMPEVGEHSDPEAPKQRNIGA